MGALRATFMFSLSPKCRASDANRARVAASVPMAPSHPASTLRAYLANKNGLEVRSMPISVGGLCPGKTRTSSPSGTRTSRMERISVS